MFTTLQTSFRDSCFDTMEAANKKEINCRRRLQDDDDVVNDDHHAGVVTKKKARVDDDAAFARRQQFDGIEVKLADGAARRHQGCRL